MKQRTLVWVLLVLVTLNTCTSRLKALISDSAYIDLRMTETESRYNVTIKHKQRIKSCILKYSAQYDIPAKLVTDVMAHESHFKHNAYSYAEARGLMQIMSVWNYLLYRIDGGRLGKYLLTKETIDYRRYWYRIGYNVESGCYILRHLKSKFGSWDIALTFYNEGYSKNFKKCRKDPALAKKRKYVIAVMGY